MDFKRGPFLPLGAHSPMLGTAVWRGGLGLDFSPLLGPSARPLRAGQTPTVHVGTLWRLETLPPHPRSELSFTLSHFPLSSRSWKIIPSASEDSSLLWPQLAFFINYLEVPACPFQLVYLPDHLACCISIPPQDYITLSAPSGITLWQGIWGDDCPFLFSF